MGPNTYRLWVKRQSSWEKWSKKFERFPALEIFRKELTEGDVRWELVFIDSHE